MYCCFRYVFVACDCSIRNDADGELVLDTALVKAREVQQVMIFAYILQI